MKIALDTNILAYAEGTKGTVMRGKAIYLGSTSNFLFEKPGGVPAVRGAAVLELRDAYTVMGTSAAVMINATDLASDHGLSIWDSVVLAAAAEAECRLLLSEDRLEGRQTVKVDGGRLTFRSQEMAALRRRKIAWE